MKTNVIIHKLDGVIIQPNTNDANARITIRQNTKDPNKAPVIKTNSWSFPFAVADIINKRIAAGGSGMSEGPVYSQEIKDENGTLEIYKAFLDLQGENVIYSCENIENITGILHGQEEWLAGVSKAVYFRDLDLKQHYIQTPYVINTIPNYIEAAIATITAFVVLDKIRDISREIGNVLSQILSVLGAIGGLIYAVIVIAWAIVVLAQIIVFMTDIFDHLIQPIKYHAGMKLRKLLEIGCDEIGLDFESTIFDDPVQANLVLLPAKKRSPEDAENQFALGFTIPNSTTTNGEYSKSFFDLLEAVKLAYRADINIENGVLHLENIGAPTVTPVFELPDLENLPGDPHRTNLREVYNSNYTVAFLEDLSEENTIDNYEGTLTSAITRPIDVSDEFAVIGGKQVNVQIPFARAFRKESLTNVEKKFDDLFQNHSKGVNKLIKAANKVTVARNKIMAAVTKAIKKLKVIGIDIVFSPSPIPPLTAVTKNAIPNRIGMMLLSKDFFIEDKILSLDIKSDPLLTKLRTDNAEKIHSQNYYETYHHRQSIEVTDENPTGNQAFIYRHDHFHLCKEGVEEIIKNRYIFTYKKRETVKVRFCDWFAENGIGEIEIEIPTLITDNYETKLITPDGL